MKNSKFQIISFFFNLVLLLFWKLSVFAEPIDVCMTAKEGKAYFWGGTPANVDATPQKRPFRHSGGVGRCLGGTGIEAANEYTVNGKLGTPGIVKCPDGKINYCLETTEPRDSILKKECGSKTTPFYFSVCLRPVHLPAAQTAVERSVSPSMTELARLLTPQVTAAILALSTAHFSRIVPGQPGFNAPIVPPTQADILRALENPAVPGLFGEIQVEYTLNKHRRSSLQHGAAGEDRVRTLLLTMLPEPARQLLSPPSRFKRLILNAYRAHINIDNQQFLNEDGVYQTAPIWRQRIVVHPVSPIFGQPPALLALNFPPDEWESRIILLPRPGMPRAFGRSAAQNIMYMSTHEGIDLIDAAEELRLTGKHIGSEGYNQSMGYLLTLAHILFSNAKDSQYRRVFDIKPDNILVRPKRPTEPPIGQTGYIFTQIDRDAPSFTQIYLTREERTRLTSIKTSRSSMTNTELLTFISSSIVSTFYKLAGCVESTGQSAGRLITDRARDLFTRIETDVLARWAGPTALDTQFLDIYRRKVAVVSDPTQHATALADYCQQE